MVNKAANKRDRRPRLTGRYGMGMVWWRVSLVVGHPPPRKAGSECESQSDSRSTSTSTSTSKSKTHARWPPAERTHSENFPLQLITNLMCAARIAVHFIDSDSDQHLEQEPRSPISDPRAPISAPVEMSVLRSTLDVCSLIRFVFACSYVTNRIWLRRVYAVCDSEYIRGSRRIPSHRRGRREAWEGISMRDYLLRSDFGLPRTSRLHDSRTGHYSNI